MTRFLPLLVLAAALVACDIDFTEVAGPDPPGIEPPPEARLVVDLVIDDRPLPELRLAAVFWPGTTADASTRGVDNDTLYLGTYPVPPRETSDGGVRDYRWGPGPESEPGTLSITAPVAEGLAALPPVLVRTYRRVGADTIHAAPGDTVRFETAPVDPAADAPSSMSWGLSLSGPDFSFHRSDTTAVPGVLTMPAGWTEWAGPAPVHVRLSVQETWRRALPDGEYEARIRVSGTLTWTVIWTEETE